MENSFLMIMKFAFLTLILCSCQTSYTNANGENDTNSNRSSNGMEMFDGNTSQNNIIPLTINFYLENSGSMFGYVNGNTAFEDVVSKLAADCAMRPKIVNFNFLNASHTSIGNELENFLGRINRTGMDVGNPNTSDINMMFRRLLSETGKNKISILVSDGIYSISGRGLSEAEILSKLKSASLPTRNEFIERLQEEDITTYCVKLTSNFNGTYTTVQNNHININQNRPYYIWIFGHKDDLESQFNEEYLSQLTGYKDIAKFVKLTGTEVKSQYISYNAIGRIRTNLHNFHELNKVKPGMGNITQFSIAFDFSGIPYSSEYFLDTEVYENNLAYDIAEIIKAEDLPPAAKVGLLAPITHSVTFSKNSSPWGTLNIKVKDLVPAWIEETNTDNDSSITNDTIHTFGFKHLMKGISDAYDIVNTSENLYEVTYTINNR